MMAEQPPAIMSERRVALLGGLLASLGPLSLALYTPAMPLIADAFEASEASVKATLSIYFAGFACAQLRSGPLSDRFGRRPIAQAFILIYLAGPVGTLLAIGLFRDTSHGLATVDAVMAIGAAGIALPGAAFGPPSAQRDRSSAASCGGTSGEEFKIAMERRACR